MRERVEMIFLGEFRPGSFAAFMQHRAVRLSISAVPHRLDESRVDVAVEGEPALVDMFEMACSLGPIDCLVREAHRSPGRTA